MDQNCATCKQPFIEEDTAVICDCCAVLLHDKCSGISPTEVRAVIMQKRTLIFFCHDCRDTFKQVPKILKGLNEALRANEVLRTENERLRQELQKVKEDSRGVTALDTHDIVREIYERQSRACNVIVRNVQESGNAARRERVQHDTDAVRRILGPVDSEFTIKRIFRLGKYDKDKVRPIKVVMASPEEVIALLKGRKNVAVPGVIIHRDETKLERDYFFTVRKKLDEHIAAGEDKVIRYVNKVPTIVDRPKHQTK